MVVITKTKARELFSARLNELLDAEPDAPRDRGRRQWLSRKFNQEFSAEAARKWLEAESIPDQAHLSMLCTAFGWSWDYLMTGALPKYAGRMDKQLSEITDLWHDLDNEGRAHVLRNARNERDLRELKPQPPSPSPPSPKRPGKQ